MLHLSILLATFLTFLSYFGDARDEAVGTIDTAAPSEMASVTKKNLRRQFRSSLIDTLGMAAPMIPLILITIAFYQNCFPGIGLFVYAAATKRTSRASYEMDGYSFHVFGNMI